MRQVMEWVFGTEKASLEHPRASTAPPRPSYGMEYVLMEQARIGAKIDKGGWKPEGHATAPQAEWIAAMVAGMPDDLGGWQMALLVAECGRTKAEPDWMPGAVPQLQPVAWGPANQHGRRGKTEVRETVEIERRGRRVRVDVPFTPCRWVPSQSTIDMSRDRYQAWIDALAYIREAMRESQMVAFEVSNELPRREPWEARRVSRARVAPATRAG